MALSFIGKPISLISHSDVRYRGILAGIDPVASTIQLSNVYSMGTESRRPAAQFIAPVQDPYTYIIFRASEVKDLAVDEPTPQPSLHDDPAILGASAPAPKAPFVPAYPPNVNAPPPPGSAPQQAQNPQQPYPPQQETPPPAAQQTHTQPHASRGGHQNAPNRHVNSVQTAAASLESVERALGDLRVSSSNQTTHPHHNTRGGGRRGRGGGRGGDVEHLKVPTTDFDFESSNAKFDKAAHSPAIKEGSSSNGDESPGGGTDGEKPVEKDPGAYNPQKSFFDSLSSSSANPAGPSDGQRHGGGGGRGRRGDGGGNMGRNRREEEREKNVATFGEPGGVGLLGPGGYVGGWGGYGRRGGRPRRGGGGGGGGRGGGGGGGGGNGQAVVPAR